MSRKQRGFSLVEVIICIGIGIVVVAGVSQLAFTGTRQMQTIRRHIAATANLDMARESLALKMRGMEPRFWRQFPLSPALTLVHESDHTHAGIQFSHTCADLEETSCMIWWDLLPPKETPLVYTVERWAEDRYLDLKPTDNTQPPDPPKAADTMSVLLFITGSTRFCRLVQKREIDTLIIAPMHAQPWQTTTEIYPGDTQVVHLGTLTVTHTTLADHDGLGRDLIHRPVSLKDSGSWRNGRRVSAYTHLKQLIWEPCSTDRPDRLTLLTAPSNPKKLTTGKTIAGHLFREEVFSAALSF